MARRVMKDLVDEKVTVIFKDGLSKHPFHPGGCAHFDLWALENGMVLLHQHDTKWVSLDVIQSIEMCHER